MIIRKFYSSRRISIEKLEDMQIRIIDRLAKGEIDEETYKKAVRTIEKALGRDMESEEDV